MSFWIYKKDKSGKRSLYSVNIASLGILIIIFLVIVLFIRFHANRDNQPNVEIKERIYYVPDEQTQNLKIQEMMLSEMLDSIFDEHISTRNKAIIIQRLATFPGKQTIEVLIRVLDEDNTVLKDHFIPEEGGGTWSLSAVPLRNVALETLNKITGNNFSGSEEAKNWFKCQQE